MSELGVPSDDGFTIDDRTDLDPRTPMEFLREAVLSIPHLAALVFRLLKDRSVPVRHKLIAGVVAGYVVVPIDLIPDVIPVLGQIDDLVLLALAAHLLIKSVPEEKVLEYWDGTEDAFDLVSSIITWGAEFIPKRLRSMVG